MKKYNSWMSRIGIRRFQRDERGVSMIEFALLLPILVVIFIGTVEVSRLVLFHQKVENATFRVADLITRIEQDPVQCNGTGGLNWMYEDALARSLEPYDVVEGDTTLIVNSIRGQYPDENNPSDSAPVDAIVEWHWSRGNAASRISDTPGDNVYGGADWPDGFDASPNAGGMYHRDRVIAVEVFHDFEPLLTITPNFLPAVQAKTVYSRAFYRARFGNMTALAGGC